MTTLTEIAEHALVRERFGVLPRPPSRRLAADPQPGHARRQCVQDARCWYYRRGWHCYRAGGNICYAERRRRSIVSTPSCRRIDAWPSARPIRHRRLIALDAQMVVRRRGGERVIAAADYFVGPGRDITACTCSSRASCWPRSGSRDVGGRRFYFEKARDRQVWDFRS